MSNEACSPGAESFRLRQRSPSGCNSAPEGGFAFSARSFSSALLGLGLGLYLSRVIAETMAPIWPWPVSLALLVMGSVMGVGLAALGWRYSLTLAPLAILYVYVLYPRIEPTLAWYVAFVTVVALAIANIKGKRSVPGDLMVFLLGFGLYVHTLAPTVLPSNSGEFQFVADILGIAHPPGYPLYTMLGKLFTLIPLSDVAYRVNLMSAFFASLTLVLVGRTVRRATDSALGGVVSALALGTATTFWAQATTANTRSLTAFFTALMLFALVSYAQRQEEVYLTLFASAFGLGITHHGSLVFLILPFVAFLLVTKPETSSFTKAHLLLPPASRILKPLLAFLLSLSVLLYLPIRGAMGTPFGPADITTPAGFLNHVLARGFRGDMFYFAKPGILLERLNVLANILDFQFGLGLLIAASLGSLLMLAKDWRLLLLCGGAIVVQALVAMTYRAPETVEYLIPAYVPLAILIGYGAAGLSRLGRFKALSACLMSLFLLLGVIRLAHNYSSFVWLSEDRSARQYAERLMANAPSGALVLANWHWATPLWYLQYSEGMRPDVEVRYVYPQGAEPISATWLKLVEENVGKRPLIVTNYYRDFEARPYRFVPLGEAFLVQSGPLFDVPEGLAKLDITFGNKIKLLGYRLLEARVASGQPLHLDLYWQPVIKLGGNYSFFVHLVGDGGQVLGQMDVTHDMTSFEPGEVCVDRYEIQILPMTPAGHYQLIAGVYITLPGGGWQRLTTERGGETVSLAEIEVEPPALRPVTLHPLHQPFANGLALIGVDYDTSLEGTWRVYLHWHRFWDSDGDYEVLLYADDRVIVRTLLPRIPLCSYLTTAHDLPLTATPLQMELRSIGGAVSARLGPWGWRGGGRLTLPTPPARSHYVDLGGEMLLAGAEYRKLPGDTVRVELRLVAKKPLLRDYVVSVRLTDEAGQLRSQDDTVPALGAIPTLKWIRGSCITDVHFVPLPVDAPVGPLELSLIVYDAFTMRPLGVLDDRLAKLGLSVPLGPLRIGSST